jgi:hypothetical protein
VADARFEHGRQQILLALEVAVHRRTCHARALADLVDADAVVAAFAEQPERGSSDRVSARTAGDHDVER